MYKIIFPVLTILVSFIANGQDYENLFDKYSKKELKEYSIKRIHEIDSMKIIIAGLNEKIKKFNEGVIDLSKSIEEQKARAESLSESLSDHNRKYEALKNEFSLQYIMLTEKNDSLGTLSRQVIALQKHIEGINSQQGASFASRTTSNDFLNKYFQNPVFLNNDRMFLSISKVIVGRSIDNTERPDESADYDFDQNNEQKRENPVYIPEILHMGELQFFKTKDFYELNSAFTLDDAIRAIQIDQFNSKLPQLEILKNKLLTIKYNDGTEENFLFNLVNGSENNFRKTYQIQLASEEVKSDGTKNRKKDIVWTILVIGEESYLALSLNQMTRIKVKLEYDESFIEKSGYNPNYLGRYKEYTLNRDLFTGDQYLIARKKDKYMKTMNYIDPESMIYLFKIQ